MNRTNALLLFLIITVRASAQVVVPFVSNVDRLMLFHNKRFKEVDARPPQRVFAMNDALLFQDGDGQLLYYTVESGVAQVIERGQVDQLQVSGERATWLRSDSLMMLRGGTSKLVATGVERFQVSDSLVVLVDSIDHELAVLHRGQRIPLAKVERNSQLPQWTQGGNTVTFYDRSRRAVSIFQHGALRILTDSTDVGMAVNGTDIVAYWDDVRDEFMGEAKGAPQRLSGLKPISAQAGNGLLAFVDGTLKLKVWDGGEVVQLTDSMPSQYWVKDELVLYLWAGHLKVWSSAGDVTVEEYVPERWQVSGDLLVYLDINRELRGIQGGKRLRFGHEANIDGFELFGEAVLYRSPIGSMVVVSNGRSYTF